MRIVDSPVTRPSHCAAIPFIGPASHPEERWIDTGAELPGFDNHVYISETATKQMAAMLGIPTQKQLDAAVTERDEALGALEKALVELASLKDMKRLVTQIRSGK